MGPGRAAQTLPPPPTPRPRSLQVLGALGYWAGYPYRLDPGGPPVGLTSPSGGPGERPSKSALTFPLPPFGRLALVQSLSSAGDAMVAVALANSVFFNVSEKAAQSDVALSLALTVAPFAVVGPLLGPMVERVRGGRRAIALAAALGRAGCCFFMAFWVHSLVLFPIAFFSLVFSKLWLVTKAALVPGTVDGQEQLVQANSKLSVGGSMAGMVAGSAGVGLLNLVGGAGLLRFDILVYLGCAIAAARLTSARRPGPVLAPRAGSPPVDQISGPLTAPPPAAEPPPTAALFAPPGLAPVAPVPPSSLPPAAVGSPSYGGAQPALPPATPRVPPEPRRGGLPPGGLQLAAIATAALRGSVGFVTFLLVFTFRHHGAALIWYGLALGASQVGNVTGALVAPRLRQRAPEEWMLTGSSVVVGGASLVAGIVHWGTHWPVAVLLAGGIGLAAGSGKVAFDSMVQRDVPSRIRARSFARFESGFQLAWALGSLLAVLIPMTLAAGFIAIGAVGLVGALAFAGGSIKARRGTLPAWFPGSAPRPTQPRLGGGPPPAPPP